jgi:dTDP-4-amino-4,6-dideoxygalactose transaminase
MLHLLEPFVGEAEARNLAACVDGNMVASVGPFVGSLERLLGDFLDVPEVVAVASGTAALHLALRGAGVLPGDEVIVPTLTFVASANAVRYLGARPVFVDVDSRTWTMPADCLDDAVTARTRAVMPVHLFGYAADIAQVCAWGQQRGVAIVEDAAEALGTRVRGVGLGTWGTLGCLSFNGNKIITAGGGGAVLCRQAALAEQIRSLASQARLPGYEYVHAEVGFNYRMSNLHGAVGVAQMERLPAILAHRTRIIARYRAGLAALPGIALPPQAGEVEWNGWVMSFLFPAGGDDYRDRYRQFMAARGIEVRPFFTPLHVQVTARHERSHGGAVAVDLHRRGVNLPSSFALTDADVDRVVEATGSFWHQHIG